MKTNSKLSFLALALVAALAACGGGGGGTSGGGTNVVPTGPAGGATPTPTPTPTSGGSGTASATGKVFDLDSGAPISGATVVIGNTLVAGATPPATLSADDRSAVTAADGSYTITGLTVGTRSYGCGNTTSGPDGYCSTASPTANAAFVHVFTSDHITLHGYASIVAGSNAIRDLKVTMPTALDTQRLTKLNFYRQSAPNPNNVWSPGPVAVGPVVLDEYLTEAERFYAPYAAANNPAVAGQDPDQGASGPNYSPNSRYHSRGGFSTLDDFENLGGGGGTNTFINLPGTIYANTVNNLPEDGFYLEGPTGGHFQRIMDAQSIWVGFGVGPTNGSGGYNGNDDLVHQPS